MSFRKVYLQDVESLKKEYKRDRAGFVRRYSKADALLGPAESHKYLQRKLDREFGYRFSPPKGRPRVTFLQHICAPFFYLKGLWDFSMK